MTTCSKRGRCSQHSTKSRGTRSSSTDHGRRARPIRVIFGAPRRDQEVGQGNPRSQHQAGVAGPLRADIRSQGRRDSGTHAVICWTGRRIVRAGDTRESARATSPMRSRSGANLASFSSLLTRAPSRSPRPPEKRRNDADEHHGGEQQVGPRAPLSPRLPSSIMANVFPHTAVPKVAPWFIAWIGRFKNVRATSAGAELSVIIRARAERRAAHPSRLQPILGH